MTDWQSHNRLPKAFNARWFVLRHGYSRANAQRLITSRLVNAEHQFGLTDAGRLEVRSNITAAAARFAEGTAYKLISSPFLRTRETAAIIGEILGVPFTVDPRLRERDFGDFEMTSDSNYAAVWTRDAERPDHTDWNGESVLDVLWRASELVAETDATLPDGTVAILVSHGDVASILTCGFLRTDPSAHRTIKPIKTAELVELTGLAGPCP